MKNQKMFSRIPPSFSIGVSAVDAVQCTRQFRMQIGEPMALDLFIRCVLAHKCQCGLFPKHHFQCTARDTHPRKGIRPFQCRCQSTAEVCIGHRFRSACIEYALQLFLGAEVELAGQVVGMDPGHPLPAIPERHTQAPFENGLHFLQGTALFAQNDPDAQKADGEA